MSMNEAQLRAIIQRFDARITDLELIHEPSNESLYRRDKPPEDKESDIQFRLSNLEAKQDEPGSIPKWYLDRTQQLEGRILHAEAKLQEHITVAMKRSQSKVPKKGLKEIES